MLWALGVTGGPVVLTTAKTGNEMRLSIVQKISLLSTLLVITTAGVVSGLFYQAQKDLMVQQALDKFSNQIVQHGLQLQGHIEGLRADTRLLASVPPIQGLLRAAGNEGVDVQGNSTTAEWQQRLQTIFRVMLEAKTDYLMVRFLAADGMELVRVEQANNEIIIAHDEGLQNKAQRDYVIETMKLPGGHIYLSEINLNRELGKVVVPHQEVLRSAIPIYDQLGGKLAGLVVLTMDIGSRLREIEQHVPQDEQAIYVTNDRGDYLLQPDDLQTYGFDLGQVFRVQDDYPGTVNFFLPGAENTRLSLLPEDTHNNQTAVFHKFPFDAENPQRFFTIGITQSYEKIIGEVLATLNKVLGIAIVLILLAALLSVLLSQRLARPIKLMTRAVSDYGSQRATKLDLPIRQGDEIGMLAQSFQSMALQVENAETSLRDLNQNLESLVEERTRKLRRSEIRQQVIVENIVDGLISINEQGVVQDFNRAAEKIFAYTASEVIGRNIKMLMPDPYSSEHDGYLKAYLEGGEAKIIGIGREVEGKRKDGSTFPMDLAINEMWFGDQRFYSGIVRDITERKHVEKMKNEFISTFSHELRTPLTSIRGSLGLLLGGIVGELPEKAMEMLKIAGNNTIRLLTLINDILDIQKIESGKMTFNSEKFLLMPFLAQAVSDHASYGEQHGVKFVITGRVDTANLYADKNRLMQVMGNLLSNAAKFSPQDAQVEIAVTRQNDDFLRISVIDVGSGIPEESLASLFEQFTQVDSSDTRKKGGTGLGLAISKIIMENLGGHIGVTSELGKGSTFYIDLPEARSVMLVLDDETSVDQPRPNKSILVVEDDPITASLIQTLLADSGYEADIAHTAGQARQMIKNARAPYRLMVLDIILPDENGISLLTSLHQEKANRDMAVVIVSVKADEARQELEGGALGIRDWLSKPVDEKRLMDTVQRLTHPEGKIRVLHIEDEPDVHRVVAKLLENNCDITWASSVGAARKKLRDEQFDLVLLDIGLPDGSGIELVDTIKACENTPQIVVFSAYDVPKDYIHRVDAALLKAKTSNSDLLNAIKKAL